MRAQAATFSRRANGAAAYAHAVFTLPRELAPLALQNKRVIYHLLFHSADEALLDTARAARYTFAEIGVFFNAQASPFA